MRNGKLTGALFALTLSLAACGAPNVQQPAQTGSDLQPGQTATVTLSVPDLRKYSRQSTTSGGIRTQGTPIGTTGAELRVYENGTEVLFDSNGHVSDTGSRVQFVPGSATRTLRLLIGRSYDFQVSAHDDSATPNELAYGEMTGVLIRASTVTLPLEFTTILGTATLSGGRTIDGAIDIVLNVDSKGRSDLRAPEGDYTVSYAVTDADIISQSKLGIRILPTGGATEVVATISGQINRGVSGTIEARLNGAGSTNVSAVTDLSTPTVNLTNPEPGTAPLAGTLIDLTAYANDDQGVTKVEFYDGVALLGEGTLEGGVWKLPWTPSARSHDLRVLAYDAANNTGSISVGVTTRDATFNTTGTQAVSFSSYEEKLNAMLLRTDGKIMLAGQSRTTTSSGGYAGSLVRLSPDGSLDSTFNTTGKYTTSVSYVNEYTALIQTPSGKVVVAGAEYGEHSSSPNTMVTQFNEDGSVDWTRNIPVGGTAYDMAYSLAVQPDGKILVGGMVDSGTTSYDPFVLRLNANGTTDTSFANNGVYIRTQAGSGEMVRSLAVQPDGKILAAGVYGGGGLLLRLSELGALDATFGTNGLADLGADLPGVSVLALQPDGRVVVVGAVAKRFITDGTLDTTYGSDGVVALPGSGTGAAWMSENKLMLATSGGTVRLTADGQFDRGFGLNGVLLGDARLVAVQRDEKFITGRTSNNDFQVSRYNP